MRLLMTGLLSAALPAAVIAPSAADVPKPIPLFAENGSGQSGTVTFKQQGPDVLVTVRLAHPSDVLEPIHIHGGTCAAPASVKWPLSMVANGTSTTVIKGVKVADLRNHGYIVNVHKSPADMSTYVACGAI